MASNSEGMVAGLSFQKVLGVHHLQVTPALKSLTI